MSQGDKLVEVKATGGPEEQQVQRSLAPEDGHIKMHRRGEDVQRGQWYWVNSTERKYDEKKKKHVDVPTRWLACVMNVGSNYVLLEEPRNEGGGTRTIRVHFDEFYEVLEREENPGPVIQERVETYQRMASEHLEEIKAITARLGVSPRVGIEHGSSSGSGGALMVLSGQSDIKAYESALVVAKEKQLPELFKKVKWANQQLVRWMSASSLPLIAMSADMEDVIEEINGRIFNVSLYAGLAERVKKCADGAPAGYDEKLHVMQRRLYADEECIAGYKQGGISIESLEDFDAWLCEQENRDRILPFPRCMVAVRVRRDPKEREWDGTIGGALLNFHLKEDDKTTLLYIRNGEQVHRLVSSLEFDEMIFPDQGDFDPSEPMMAKLFCGCVEKMITRALYEQMEAEEIERRRNEAQWEKDNPAKGWNEKEKGYRGFANPYRDIGRSFNESDWHAFDPSSVYFDDVADEVRARVEKYNRVAVLIQGLFDRSEVLHPHPPVKTWTAEGFAASIKLVYDGKFVLHDGEAPDFEAYRRACNESMCETSVVIGQEDVWLTREAEKENKRIERDWRQSNKRYHEKFRPYGNPGPGFIATMSDWRPRSRKATFVWHRDRLRDGNYFSGKVAGQKLEVSLQVDAEQLFNVSAYKPGDFKRFFQDARTRKQYLKWAKLLITAEEYHTGKIVPRASAKR
jgi:hypothetical protein